MRVVRWAFLFSLIFITSIANCDTFENSHSVIGIGDTRYWKKDGSNGPATGDWDLGNYSISNLGDSLPFADNSTTASNNAWVQGAINLSMATMPLNLGAIGGGTYSFAASPSAFTVLNYTAVGGVITSINSIVTNGFGFVAGDLISVNSGNHDSLVHILTVNGSGGATSVELLYGGSGYTSSTSGSTGLTNAVPFTFLLSGTLTSNATFIMPHGTYLNLSNQWIFCNNTTGAFTLTVGVAGATDALSGGRTVIIPQGTNNSASTFIQTDGVLNVDLADAGALLGYVPYTGASSNVNLGSHNLTTTGTTTTGNAVASEVDTAIPEFITNGDFASDLSSWNNINTRFTWVSANVARRSTTGSGNFSQTQVNMTTELTTGERYRITFTVSNIVTGGNWSISCAGVTVLSSSAIVAQTYSIDFVAVNQTSALSFVFPNPYLQKFDLSSVSIRQLKLADGLYANGVTRLDTGAIYTDGAGDMVIDPTFSLVPDGVSVFQLAGEASFGSGGFHVYEDGSFYVTNTGGARGVTFDHGLSELTLSNGSTFNLGTGDTLTGDFVGYVHLSSADDNWMLNHLLIGMNTTADATSALQVNGAISTSGMPTSDPADGKHTLWADTTNSLGNGANIIYQGT